MRRRVAVLLALSLFTLAATTIRAQSSHATAALARPDWLDAYRDPAARLIGEAIASTFAWERLALLSDTFGNRLSGSQALEDAIRWAVAEMKKDGLENVHTEPVKVPHWVRGRRARRSSRPSRHAGDARPRQQRRHAGRRRRGRGARRPHLRGARRRGRGAAGRIVLFNVPFTTLRRDGAVPRRRRRRAPRRSARRDPRPLRRPARTADAAHRRAALRRRQPQIPAAAITTEDAERLQRMQDRGTAGRGSASRWRRTSCPTPTPPTSSARFAAASVPDEVVVVGGHLDSWDVGTGSTDDGGGCIVTWEALRLMKKLNLRPRRTVRVVLWTNEENGSTRRARLPRSLPRPSSRITC